MGTAHSSKDHRSGETRHKLQEPDQCQDATTLNHAPSSRPLPPPEIDAEDPLAPVSLAGKYSCLLATSMLQSIPQPLRTKWRVLYTTREGRSFPRLVRSICQAGPTLVVIELLLPSSLQLPESHRRVLLCAFNSRPWLTMADRRGAGKDPAAEKRQAAGFFGDTDCFVSHHWNLEGGTSCSSVRKPPVGRSCNGLFMFLVDEGLSIGQLVVTPGIGMGGPVGRQAWAMNEDLEFCTCDARCSTFVGEGEPSGCFGLPLPPSSASSSQLTCEVLSFDVYALNERLCPPEVRREAERKALVKSYVQDMFGGGGNGNERRSVLDGNEALAVKAVLELAGAHQFHQDSSSTTSCS